MLYYAGNGVHEVYRSLVEATSDEEFDAAKKRLSDHFEPQINLTYEIFHFRKIKQGVSAG